MPYVGTPLRRREDARFLKGKGRYVDDINLPNMAYIVFIRSPYAHARIRDISVGGAVAMPGVLRILTAKDWSDAGHGDIVLGHTPSFSDGRPMHAAYRPAFAKDKVCHVGDVVAAVVADSRNLALDAAEAVDVTYEELPAIVDAGRALDHDAPIVHARIGSNLALEVTRGDQAATERAFAEAAHITSLELVSPRIAGMPMEPFSYVASHDQGFNETTLWASHQLPHILRQYICRHTLHIPENKLRVIAPDVGGGFGVKGNILPEISTIVWMARDLGRAVKWTATRSEALMTETQARDHVSKARMAFDRNGLILGLEIDTIAAFGAYVSSNAPGIPTNSYSHAITGLYRTPNLFLRIRCVYTNTVPVSAYRGSGRPEATFVNERLLENGAREMGIDVVDLRRRNLIQADQYPYRAPVGRVYDSGNPPALLDKLLKLSRYDDLRLEQGKLRAEGKLLGIGLAAFLDKSGAGPSRQLPGKVGLHGGYESANVRVHTDAKITIFVGTHSHGQGHDTAYAAIAADRLGIPIDDIDIVEGDTGRVQFGNGTWGSRSISVAGPAIQTACDEIIAKMRRIAGHVLECEPDRLLYENQFFLAPHTNRKISFLEITEIAYGGARLPKKTGFEPGLEALSFYDPIDLNDPLAMHLAVVLIDRELCSIELRDYYAVDDCGVIINPMIKDGQVHGGIAQGIGQAMLERVIYDPASGQLVTGTFMDYAMPRASDIPRLKLDFHVTPAPGNPLGVKGGSESGTIGPPAAIGNAVVDALWSAGVRHVALPLAPDTIRHALGNHRLI